VQWDQPEQLIHRAECVLAEAGSVLSNAAVQVCRDGRILDVSVWDRRHSPSGQIVDWGRAVLMPGLVNAHTHLELTCMRKQLPRTTLPQWLKQLVETSRQWDTAQYLQSAQDGAQECVQSGTTLVGDISAQRCSARALKNVKLRKVVFEEVLSLAPEKAPEIIAALSAHLHSFPKDPLLRPGISPHTPYTVSTELYSAACELASRLGIPVASHVAESSEELAFMENGSGGLKDFLNEVGALPANWAPAGAAPVAYLSRLGALQGGMILIHGNYLDPASIAQIAQHNCPVVYCPRSSVFFGHSNHPVRRLIDQGITVALGTDSLASNESLSMLDEMRFLFRLRRDLTAGEIFRMATLNGAKVLGYGSVTGALKPGCAADMAVLALEKTGPRHNLLAEIMEGSGTCLAALVQGELAWSRAEQV
jgi:cytosine/adenosine deaminase-related metal-dependent hydrolase